MASLLRINRNAAFLVTLALSLAVAGGVWLTATQERARHRQDYQTFQQAIQFIDKDRKFADAEPLLRDLLNRDPQSYVLHWRLGFVLANGQRFQDAVAAYERAMDLNPFLVRDGTFLLLIGDAYYQLEEYAKARAYLQGALDSRELSQEIKNDVAAVLKAMEAKGKP